jgi:nucleobase transporter 1/2
MFGSTFSIPMLIAPALCVSGDELVTAEILGTILFVSGLITILQSTLGSR